MLANMLLPMLMVFAVTAMPPMYDDSRQSMYFGKPYSYPYKQGSEKDDIRLSDALQALKDGKNRDRFYFGKTDDQRGHQIQDERGANVIIITLNDVDSVMDSLKKFMPFMKEDSRLWDSDTFRDSSRYNRNVEKTSIKVADVLETLKQGENKYMFYFGSPDDQRGDQTEDERKPKLIIITFHPIDADVESLRKLMPFMNHETRLLDLDMFRNYNRFNRDTDIDINKLSDVLQQLRDGDNNFKIYFGKTDEQRGDQKHDEKNEKLIIISLIDVDSAMISLYKLKDQIEKLREENYYNRV